MKKKIGIIIAGVVVLAVIGVSLFIALNPTNSIGIIGGADGPTSIIVSEKDDSLDQMVSAAILANSYGRYLEGECVAEGHIILGTEENVDETTIYALTMYGEYGFQDNNFVKISGSGVIPAVLRITKNDQGATLSRIDWPRDGSGYVDSIKELFTKKYHNRVISIKDKDSKVLKQQEVSYAKAYLTRIGRKAEIGDYADFQHILLTDLGVSVEVSNKLADKEYANYPYWVGNKEKLENGIRYVYELVYDKDNNEIVLSKYNYETKEVVEKITLNSLTGEKKTNIFNNDENSGST